MNLVWGALAIVAVTGVAVTAMLLARRNTPDGSYFADGDRASGVFGVLAAGFSILLGFIIFLAFSSSTSHGWAPRPSRWCWCNRWRRRSCFQPTQVAS